MSSSERRPVKKENLAIEEIIPQVTRSMRDLQPGHYLLKIKSFSVLAESKIKRYESSEFEAGGYKWKLCLYPNGKNDGNGSSNYISLYLAISDTSSLPQGWEVNVHCNFFVYDHIKDKYLTIQESGGNTITRFHVMKTEGGIDQMLPLDLFKNASNGYLREDSCVFGVEVMVIKYAGLGQCVEMKKEFKNLNTYTWKIERFSTIKEDIPRSKSFRIGDLWWNLWVYPKGERECRGKSISLYFAPKKLPLQSRVYAEYKLRIMSQHNTCPSEEYSYSFWFHNTDGYGSLNFMPLSDLHDKSKGYIVNDTVFVEAEITITAVAKNLS